MKRYVKLFLSLLLIGVMLVGCSEEADKNETKKEPQDYVQEMLTALCQEDIDAAAALMHPSAGDTKAKMQGLSKYVAGKEVTQMTKQEVDPGKFTPADSPLERMTYDVVMEDGSTLTVQCVFLDDDAGTGFTQFYFSFGK